MAANRPGFANRFSLQGGVVVIPQGYPRRIAHVPPNFNSTLAWLMSPSLRAVPQRPRNRHIMRRAFSLGATAAASPLIVELAGPTPMPRLSPIR